MGQFVVDHSLMSDLDPSIKRVEVGFEGLSTPHGFVDGDALLTLYMDGVQLRNTTSVNGKYWNFTQPIPFTYGDVTWTVELESLGGSNIIGT